MTSVHKRVVFDLEKCFHDDDFKNNSEGDVPNQLYLTLNHDHHLEIEFYEEGVI